MTKNTEATERNPASSQATRSPELQDRINNALRLCNAMLSSELSG
jgi:hypothetical protein